MGEDKGELVGGAPPTEAELVLRECFIALRNGSCEGVGGGERDIVLAPSLEHGLDLAIVGSSSSSFLGS